MTLADRFNADDPYQSVALIFAGFLCEQCGEYCSGDPDGSVENVDVPFQVMAAIARGSGWLVEARDPVRYDYVLLCPMCRSGLGSSPDSA